MAETSRPFCSSRLRIRMLVAMAGAFVSLSFAVLAADATTLFINIDDLPDTTVLTCDPPLDCSGVVPTGPGVVEGLVLLPAVLTADVSVAAHFGEPVPGTVGELSPVLSDTVLVDGHAGDPFLSITVVEFEPPVGCICLAETGFNQLVVEFIPLASGDDIVVFFRADVNVPEPATSLLVGLGVAALFLLRRRTPAGD